MSYFGPEVTVGMTSYYFSRRAEEHNCKPEFFIAVMFGSSSVQDKEEKLPLGARLIQNIYWALKTIKSVKRPRLRFPVFRVDIKLQFTSLPQSFRQISRNHGNSPSIYSRLDGMLWHHECVLHED